MSRRLTIVIHSLQGGGAERTVAEMANYWSRHSNEVTLITLDTMSNDNYEVAPEVNRVELNLMIHSRNILQALSNNLKRITQLRRAIRDSNPDVIISFTDKTNVLTMIATRRMSLPVVLAERSDPWHQSIGRIWSRLRRRFYPSCAAIVVQTDSIREFFTAFVKNKPIRVIPNCIWNVPDVVEKTRSAEQRRQVASLGRLSIEKGYDLLIKAFAKISDNHLDWDLVIAGTGNQQDEIEKLIDELGLSERVQLLGWTNKPTEILQRSDLFVLPSRYEGFPNALLEAMAHGLAVISFDCPSGPRAIIRDDVDGILVPPEDVDALVESMNSAMSDEALRNRLGEKAREVSDRFGVEAYFEKWEEVLDHVAKRS